jgi:hypothetical protein
MRVKHSLVFLGCILTGGEFALGQAISQGILLNQQATQSSRDASAQQPRIIQPAGGGSSSSQQKTPNSSFDPAGTPTAFEEPGRSKQPYLSEYAGYVTPGTELTISSPVPGAVIYYTTDGWTPTEESYRFVDPIKLDRDTRVQAFAVEPGMLPSPVVDATYIVKPQQPPLPKTISISDSTLHKGMPLRLVTATEERSNEAQVGDTLQLKLDQNLMVGDTIVAARGSLGKATITRAEHAGRGGKPGALAFKVESLDVNGVSIPLSANLTLAAPDIAAQAAKISNPSVVRISGTLPKGDEAVIEPGMPLTAIVEEDTELH